MKRLQGCLLAGLLMLFTNYVGAAERAMIVLDASGSMWGQINGKPKLQIAREALSTVLEGVPADMELGLIAYGHREKGNCNDIELIVEPAAGTAQAIAQAAATMRFLGKTPLTASVKQAAEALRYTEDKATVILITDGLENCNADPCALGAELAKQGLDFTAHVVGFDLSDAEGKQVACLAENTGGQYVSAANADELLDALLSTVIKPAVTAMQPTPAVETAVVLPAATLESDQNIAIGADITINWTGPDAENDYIDLVPADYKKTHGELSYTYTKEGAPLSLRAPGKPGVYKTRYIWRGTDNKRHVLAEAEVKIVDSEVALVAPNTTEAGSFIAVEWKGPGNESDYIDLVPAGYKETSGELSYVYAKSEPVVNLRAPTKAGNYLIRYILNSADKRRILASVPLEVTDALATVSLAETAEAGSVMSVFWTGPASSDDYIDVVSIDHKHIGGELAYFRPANSEDGESGELSAPTKSGEYVVRYILRGAGKDSIIASQSFTVTAAEAQLSVPSSVQAGSVIEVGLIGPKGQEDYIDLVAADHKHIGGELAYFRPRDLEDGEPGELTAPTETGEYVVRYILRGAGQSSIIATQPLTVTAE